MRQCGTPGSQSVGEVEYQQNLTHGEERGGCAAHHQRLEAAVEPDAGGRSLGLHAPARRGTSGNTSDSGQSDPETTDDSADGGQQFARAFVSAQRDRHDDQPDDQPEAADDGLEHRGTLVESLTSVGQMCAAVKGSFSGADQQLGDKLVDAGEG